MKNIFQRIIMMLIAGSLCNFGLFAQMVEGVDIPEFGKTFDVDAHKLNYDVSASLMHSSIPGNILWPGDKAEFKIQIQNKLEKKVTIKGKLDVISFATKGRPGDIWTPEMFKLGDVLTLPFEVSIEANGFSNVDLSPSIPEKFGAYGLVVDLGEYKRQFLTSCVRTFAFGEERIQYPSFCLDDMDPTVLKRMGVHAIRHGIDYKPSTDADFESWYQKQVKKLKEYNDAGIVVLVKMGAGDPQGDYLPLGTVRPWLDDKGMMLNTKSDYAWKPSYDEDFKKLVYRFASELGWPKGPINAFALWNEPWEGISISGWGADMLRYREIYSKMAEAVFDAREKAGVDILVGGCSSTANALDKLFPDGPGTFLDKFDFCSIHYQGLTPYATIKMWVDRKNPRGRVKVWDTESWVANTDDRVAAVVASNRSAGYDRAMGVYGGNITERRQSLIRSDKAAQSYAFNNAWPVAASVGAVQHFLGERPFKEILFKKGLPWIDVFEGIKNNPDDGTLVVVGDIGEEYGADIVLHRTVRGLKEIAHKEALNKELTTLDPVKNLDKIKQIKNEIDRFEVLSDAEMIVDNKDGLFSLFDFYGNPVEGKNDKIIVPLDSRGFFLRANGKPGSFEKLIDAVKKSRINGFEPVEIIAHDMLRPIDKGTQLHLTLTNILNRPVTGVINVKLGDLIVKASGSKLSFAPYETKEYTTDISGTPATGNTYSLSVVLDAGMDGKAVLNEKMHVNYISKRSIAIDGNLDDWEGVLPQPIVSENAAERSLTEAAWFPFMKSDQSSGTGFSNGYLAYDDKYLYFAAKVADDSPEAGMRRFDGGNEDYCFYPDTSYKKDSGTEYSIRYTGKVKPQFSGKYTFITNSDDGVRLWIDGKQVINDWTYHGPTINFGSMELVAGTSYDIKMEYFQAGGGATAQLFWESKDQKKEIIPASCLYSASNKSNTGDGLDASMFMGVNFDKLIVNCVTPVVNLELSEGNAPNPAFEKLPVKTLVWPKDIRKFSYRMNPELPAGNFADHDNIQIAFNVLSDDEKSFYPFPPGTMPKYTNYQCTDYEYALNPVSDEFGGGTEVYRLRYPSMPFKHHFPRQPKVALDGAVAGAILKIKRDKNTRIVESAIPWSEIPAVKAKLDKGETIKFSYRVNDNTNRGCMELSRLRSVAKRNNSFEVDWVEHWANELEFSFEKK